MSIPPQFLTNWGINTFGAWSMVQNYSNIPYTLVASTKKQNIGKIENAIDPFNPQFIIDLKNNLNNLKNHAVMRCVQVLMG